ncbi:hypothetical protein [Streptomyces sp. NPDC055210]
MTGRRDRTAAPHDVLEQRDDVRERLDDVRERLDADNRGQPRNTGTARQPQTVTVLTVTDLGDIP